MEIKTVSKQILNSKANAVSATIDPTQIQDPSQIPPQGANYDGLSPQGLVDVYSGTLSGDIDASPSAQELLQSAPDTGGLANADYVYDSLSRLYSGAQLPTFQSPSGNNVKAIVFDSGSSQGPYGAFHIEGTQTAGNDPSFNRIVVDSINASGNYSSGSGFNNGAQQASNGSGFTTTPLLPYMGPHGLFGITKASDPTINKASKQELLKALAIQRQAEAALTTYLLTGNPNLTPFQKPSAVDANLSQQELAQQLARTNKNVQALLEAVAAASPGRQYLSTALFAAELTESFEKQTGTANAGQTDGEGLSRVVAFKLAPEIALVPGFNSAVTQQWWQDGHPDWINDNSQSDQSTDGNAAGVMFLEFMNDYLGVPLQTIIQNMPVTQDASGSPLGQTYANLAKDNPQMAQRVAQLAGNGATGTTGQDAFKAMINLLTQNAQNPDGTLNLPANGNPFPSMPGAVSGGLYASNSNQQRLSA
jgi:hypothetical protein